MPDGWPTKLDALRVWSGSDFKDLEQYAFNDNDIEELENELGYYRGIYRPFKSVSCFKSNCVTGLHPSDSPDNVTTDEFSLPTPESRINDVSTTLHEGIGFAVLRGLDPKKYSPLDNLLLYLGTTSYVAGTWGCQDYDGRMVSK